VMEMCKGGELFDRVRARKRYTERKAARVHAHRPGGPGLLPCAPHRASRHQAREHPPLRPGLRHALQSHSLSGSPPSTSQVCQGTPRPPLLTGGKPPDTPPQGLCSACSATFHLPSALQCGPGMGRWYEGVVCGDNVWSVLRGVWCASPSHLAGSEPLSESMGSPLYMAPEVIEGCGYRREGRPVVRRGGAVRSPSGPAALQRGAADADVLAATREARLQFSRSVPISDWARDLVCRLLCRSPRRRLSAIEALGMTTLVPLSPGSMYPALGPRAVPMYPYIETAPGCRFSVPDKQMNECCNHSVLWTNKLQAG